ncbi:MAG: SPOR domain-containing protein [Treponema sp.]|nr:SPOR domain-containing protein [Treponema sp.]
MKTKLLKTIISTLLMAGVTVSAFADMKAKDLAAKAAKEDGIEESISLVKESLSGITTASEKRAAYVLLASLQEQMALYDAAQKNYATAAGIAAGDAEGMPKKTNEQLVLDAVRCSLSCGDFNTADSYLNSAVRNSKNAEIQSYVKLYAQWSALCRAENVEDLNEPLELLKAYLKVSSMKSVHPVILLTLWYVTGDTSYSKNLTAEFPASTEASIVKGDIQLLPTPFWFFVPKSGIAEQGTGTFKEEPAAVTPAPAKSTAPTAKFTKYQLGLFRTQKNAELLCQELKNKGFSAYTTSETRSSGTTYYLVLVNDDKTETIADKLRSAGYECYPVD